jgi:hypothetical protein
MKYRKKPVVIDAVVLDHENMHVPSWILTALHLGACTFVHDEATKKVIGMDISTLEGVMRADIGDYIIRGVKGEIYPCKPDIFHLSYEKAE